MVLERNISRCAFCVNVFTFKLTGDARVVRPHSWMYWTDWEEDEVNDSIGRIERAWMDGSHRSIFVTSNMLWPNGLTLDHGAGTMYWCDAYYDHIERIHLNGTGRMVRRRLPSLWAGFL